MSTAPGNPANPPAAGPCTAATHFTAPALPSKETPAMTTPLTAGPARTAAAAILRAVADLIETRPDLPEPGSSVSFYLSRPGRARRHGGHRLRPAVRAGRPASAAAASTSG